MHHIVARRLVACGVLVPRAGRALRAPSPRAGRRRCPSCRSSTPTIAVWQRALARRRGAGGAARLLARRLAGAPAAPRAARPTGRARRSQPAAAAAGPCDLPAAAAAAARGRWPGAAGATLFMVLLAAFQALLHRSRRRATLLGRLAGRQPQPGRDRGADRLLRQHPGPARRSARAIPTFRELLARVARDRARRLRPPGPPLRAAGRGAGAASATSPARRCSR